MDASISYWKSFGTKFCVPKFEGEPYLIGVKVATFLKRETFNMYRSMKIKNILVKRATIEQVEFLVKSNIVRVGTHSVTLIPFEEGMYFLADAWIRMHKSNSPYSRMKQSKKNTSFLKEKPKLHRRKPAAWEVQRSLGKDDIRRRILPDAFETSAESKLNGAHMLNGLLEASLDLQKSPMKAAPSTRSKKKRGETTTPKRKATRKNSRKQKATPKSSPTSSDTEPRELEPKNSPAPTPTKEQSPKSANASSPTAAEAQKSGIYMPYSSYCEASAANMFPANPTAADLANYNLPPYYYSQQHPLSKIPRWTFLNYATTTT